ncbi:MAG: hypothetical protein ACO3JL_07215 [Myxococcota bacterium]
MVSGPRKPPSQTTVRLALGAFLTVQEFAKLLLAGRKEPRMCPRCAYKLVEPTGQRFTGFGKPRRHLWACTGCRARYESDDEKGPFRAARTQEAGSGSRGGAGG